MTKLFDVTVPLKKSNGDTYWHKIGIASPTRDSTGFSCTISSIPLNWDGKCFLFPAHPRKKAEDDEEVPF